jgi:predicted MPP superfamily phosphohydrolase
MQSRISIALLILLFSSAVFSQEDFRVTCGPYLQNAGENEMTIVWITNRNAVSWVELAPNDGSSFYAEKRPQFYETSMGSRCINTVHKIRLQDLQKGTAYRYRVFSREVTGGDDEFTGYGKTVASDVFRKNPFKFTTLSAEKSEVRFAMVNDIHGDSARLSDLLRQTDLQSLDFVILNGDMVGSMDSEEQVFNGFLSQIGTFAAELPFFFARGNHETRGVFSSRYMDYFPTSTGMPYYSFRQGDACFIVLDAGEDKPDNDIEYGGLAAFDQYRKTQVKWLEKVLESKEFQQSPVKIVIIHIPPATDDSDNWHGTLEARRLFVPLLNKAGINLMLCGHLHKFAFYGKGENTGCDFPVLINSHTQIADIRYDKNSINIRISNEEGNLVKEIKL